MAKIFKAVNINSIPAAIALILILYLGNTLRFFNYATVPHPGETADEYVFAWAGLSLLKDKVPVGWTGVTTGYKQFWYEKINVDNIFDKDPERPAFRLTKPWFDKPPGFAIVVGGYSYLKGAREFVQTSVGITRRLMLRISVLTTILIFILGTRLYNKRVGVIAAFLYSIIPTTVVSSRLVLAENGYIPIYLGSLILIDYYLKEKKKLFLILGAILSAIAIFFKLSGISVLVSLLLVLLAYSEGRRKVSDFVLTFIIGISGLAAFFLYGFNYDWAIFKDVFFAQSNLIYGAGAEAFLSAVVRSKVTATKFLSDGWITTAWISTFIVSAIEWKKHRGTTILTISIFSYLLVFLIFGSEGYGWYRFPFLPLLIISMAHFIEKLYNDANLLVFLGLALLPFGTSMHRLYGIEGFTKFVNPLRIFLIMLLVLFAGILYLRKEWWMGIYKIIFVVIMVLLTILSIRQIYFFNYDTWFFVT